MIRVGVFGSSFGGKIHLPAFQLDSRAKVVAIYGRNQERLKELTKNSDIQIFTDWREILEDKNIDAVSIALPPFVQVEVLEALASANKHVLIEKPVGLGEAKTRELLHDMEERKLIHSIDFEFPFLPAWQRFFQNLKSISPIKKLEVNWHSNAGTLIDPTSWKLDSARMGGVLNNLASHSLHYVEWFMGKASNLQANIKPDGLEVMIQMQFTQGVANIHISRSSQRNTHCLEVFGEKGSIVLENPSTDYMNGFVLKIKDSSGENKETFPDPTGFSDGRVVAVGRIVKRFLDSIELGKSQWPSLNDGVRNEQLLEACRQASKLQKIISV